MCYRSEVLDGITTSLKISSASVLRRFAAFGSGPVVISATCLWQSASLEKWLAAATGISHELFAEMCSQHVDAKRLIARSLRYGPALLLEWPDADNSLAANAILTTGHEWTKNDPIENPNSVSRDAPSRWMFCGPNLVLPNAAWHGSCFTAYPTMAAADLAADDGTKKLICKEADAKNPRVSLTALPAC